MKKITINEIEISVAEEIANVYNFFKDKTDTIFLPESFTSQIVKVFSLNFIRGIQDYYSDEGISRSNWTQHTANVFFQTCQQFRMLCDFEVEKRHDGAIRDNEGNIYLSAEWEFDTNTIFKLNGEIEKLYKTSKKHSKSDAMLFTYKVESEFNDYAFKVYEQWNSFLNDDEDFKLFLLTALLRRDDNSSKKSFYGIRILVFGNKTVDVWEDVE